MIKIAHVATTFNSGTGMAADTMAIAEEQRKCGWEVEFVTGRHANAELVDRLKERNFPFTRIDSLRKYIHPADDARAFMDLFRLFKKKRFDVVHTHLAKAGVLGRLAARLAGTRTVIHTVYGASFSPAQPRAKFMLLRSLERLAGRVSKRLVFVGRELRDAYVKAGVCTREKTEVIYYGKDIAPFLKAASLSEEERLKRRQTLGLNGQDIILGSIARIVPWKGHHHAINLLHGLKKECANLKLMIVGAAKVPSEQAYQEKLVTQARHLGVTEEVIFTGWQNDTPFFYSMFDIYVLTSLPLEGVSISVLEAASAGLPVVAFDCFGVREVLGERARIVPNQDVASLAAAIKEEISKVPQTRGSRQENSAIIENLQERHSVERMVAEYRHLYEGLLAPRETQCSPLMATV